MVGNDVVDLVDREVCSGPAHPRFDARFLHHGRYAAFACEVGSATA